MAYLKLNNVRIAGMSAAVPLNSYNSLQWMVGNGVPESLALESICETGVKERRFTLTHTGSDLSYQAANRLLDDLKWDRKDVDALISVSNFPDYIMPNNACILQDRLGLDTHCYSHDICEEASGWIYGLSSIASLMRGGGVKKALLLTGVGRVKLNDSTQDYMFGHAASATALEYEPLSEPFNFYFGTNAKDSQSLYVNQYGMRLERDKGRLKDKEFQGVEILELDSYIDMKKQFTFSEEGCVRSIQNLCDRYSVECSNFDYLLLHQISKTVNDSIVKRVGVKSEIAPTCLSNFGNTGASSIPLTIITGLKNELEKKARDIRLICCGCGEFSLSAVSFSMKNVVMPKLIEVEE